MNNSFMETIDKAKRENWCTRFICTTCGALTFRKAIACIADLQAALESVDLEQFTARWTWGDIVCITATDHVQSINWDPVLARWLVYAEQHIDFLIQMLFLIRHYLRCSPQTRASWFMACADMAMQKKNDPLLNAALLACSPDDPRHAELLTAAMERHAQSPILHRTLVSLGHLRSDDDIRREQNRTVAGKNLFNAVRRNDIKAVQALLAKKADLTVTNKDGLTPVEYARAVARADVLALFDATP